MDIRLGDTFGVSIPESKQYAQMLDAAAEGGYAYPAVNVSSSETLNAALGGFAEAESDGIVEVTTGGAAYVLRDAIRYGVVKVNVDTDMQFVFTRAIADMCARTAYVRRSTSTRARGDAPRKPPWRMR